MTDEGIFGKQGKMMLSWILDTRWQSKNSCTVLSSGRPTGSYLQLYICMWIIISPKEWGNRRRSKRVIQSTKDWKPGTAEMSSMRGCLGDQVQNESANRQMVRIIDNLWPWIPWFTDFLTDVLQSWWSTYYFGETNIT